MATTTHPKKQYPAECPVCQKPMGGDIPWFIQRLTEGHVEQAQDWLAEWRRRAKDHPVDENFDKLVLAAKICGEQEARAALIGLGA